MTEITIAEEESRWKEIGNKLNITGKLEPKLKEQWLTALRSGRYRQGRASLRQFVDSRRH